MSVCVCSKPRFVCVRVSVRVGARRGLSQAPVAGAAGSFGEAAGTAGLLVGMCQDSPGSYIAFLPDGPGQVWMNHKSRIPRGPRFLLKNSSPSAGMSWVTSDRGCAGRSLLK